MAETIRCGIYFKAASRSVPVENFLRRVGVTRLDTSDGPQKNKQTFWFASKAAFDKELPGIVESINAFTVHHPIPVFQVVAEEQVSDQPQGSSVQSERLTHNQEVASANLAPATTPTEDAPTEEAESPESNASPAHAVLEPVKNRGGRPRKHAK